VNKAIYMLIIPTIRTRRRGLVRDVKSAVDATKVALGIERNLEFLYVENTISDEWARFFFYSLRIIITQTVWL